MKVSEGFMLRVLNGEFRGKVFPLRDSIDIGSAGECELCIRDSLVSPSHARLQREGDELVIEDLGTSRGTFLNERPVDRASLRTGDLLRVGGTRLSVSPDTGHPGGSSTMKILFITYDTSGNKISETLDSTFDFLSNIFIYVLVLCL